MTATDLTADEAAEVEAAVDREREQHRAGLASPDPLAGRMPLPPFDADNARGRALEVIEKQRRNAALWREAADERRRAAAEMRDGYERCVRALERVASKLRADAEFAKFGGLVFVASRGPAADEWPRIIGTGSAPPFSVPDAMPDERAERYPLVVILTPRGPDFGDNWHANVELRVPEPNQVPWLSVAGYSRAWGGRAPESDGPVTQCLYRAGLSSARPAVPVDARVPLSRGTTPTGEPRVTVGGYVSCSDVWSVYVPPEA